MSINEIQACDNPLGLFNLTTNLLHLAYRSYYALQCEGEFLIEV